jgi:transglutaminase-like putative cysteine protease
VLGGPARAWGNSICTIRYGFDVALDLAQPTTILTMMDVHSEVRRGVAEETELEFAPPMPTERFVDDSGNIVRRLSAPAGTVSLRLQGVFRSDGWEDEVDTDAEAVASPNVPQETLPFLRPSRYCDTDLLADFAWANFGAISRGWARVQAICDFVHQRLRFSYPEARSTRTASEAMAEGLGVCRDFAHLAVALCRCVNIPARYCNGYLGDIGVHGRYGAPGLGGVLGLVLVVLLVLWLVGALSGIGPTPT